MEPLAFILSETIAGRRATPAHLERGARLDYDADNQQLIITRVNKAPDEAEMKIFVAYLKRVGYRVSSSTPAEIEPGINSWVGYCLRLVKLEPTAPQAKQESLF
jgi:hypothetical protein